MTDGRACMFDNHRCLTVRFVRPWRLGGTIGTRLVLKFCCASLRLLTKLGFVVWTQALTVDTAPENHLVIG